MKKTILALFVVTLALSFPLNSVASVSVGDGFVFVVKKAYGSFSYTVGTTLTEGNTTLFRVGSTGVHKNQEIEVNVTDIDSSTVDFNIYNNKTLLSSPTSSGIGFGLGLILYSLYPFLVMGISTGSVNPIDPTKGVSLGDSWFIAPPSVSWTQIADYYNDTANWQGFYDDLETNEGNLTASSISLYYEEDDTISFSITASGTYIIGAESTSLTVIHILRFDYVKSTNVLQGYNINTLITGDYKGEDTTFSMNAQITEENYSRRLGIPGFFVSLGAIFTIGIVYAILQKKKG